MPFDYKKEFSEFYLPAKKPSIIKIPAMNFVVVSGKGNPNEEGGFERKCNNLSEFRKTVRKFILITVVFLGLFAEKATAQSNKIIKFDVYEGNGYIYRVSENLLFINGNMLSEIYILSETEEGYEDYGRFFRPFLYGKYPFPFYPDRGHYPYWVYGDDTPDFSDPEKIDELYLGEGYVNAILANTFRTYYLLGEDNKENHEEKISFLMEYYLPFLNKSQLRILRNTIYAHYGYRFASKDLQELFNKCNVGGIKWYNSVDSFDEAVITEPHREFINLIKKFEDMK